MLADSSRGVLPSLAGLSGFSIQTLLTLLSFLTLLTLLNFLTFLTISTLLTLLTILTLQCRPVERHRERPQQSVNRHARSLLTRRVTPGSLSHSWLTPHTRRAVAGNGGCRGHVHNPDARLSLAAQHARRRFLLNFRGKSYTFSSSLFLSSLELSDTAVYAP